MTRRTSSQARLGCAIAFICSVAVAGGCMLGNADGAAELVRSVFPSMLELRQAPLPEGSDPDLKVYEARGASGPVGYAVEEEVVSRSGPFIIMVIVDPQLYVRKVEVLSYPGERGGEVQSPAFLRQFEGKGRGDPIRLGEDIDAVTGATISSRAVAGGVRRAVRLVEKGFGITP